MFWKASLKSLLFHPKRSPHHSRVGYTIFMKISNKGIINCTINNHHQQPRDDIALHHKIKNANWIANEIWMMSLTLDAKQSQMSQKQCQYNNQIA